MYGVEGDNLSRWYKHHMSDYKAWEQRFHAMEYVLFKENLGERLSMDETALSQGGGSTPSLPTNPDAEEKARW